MTIRILFDAGCMRAIEHRRRERVSRREGGLEAAQIVSV